MTASPVRGTRGRTLDRQISICDCVFPVALIALIAA